MKTALLTFIFIISGLWGISQATYTWNLAGGGNWATAGNWTPARTLPAANDILVFNNGGSKTITFPVSQSIGALSIAGNTTITLEKSGAGAATLTIGTATGGTLNIESGSTLNLTGNNGTGARTMTIAFTAGGSTETGTIAGSFNLTGASADDVGIFLATNGITTVTGTLTRNFVGTIASTTANLIFGASGIYNHNVNGGVVPTATWNATSTVQLNGLTDAYPTGMTQTFGNVLFQSAFTNDIEIDGNLNCAGNLTISHTGAGNQLRLTNDNTDAVISVGGNFSQTSGEFVLVSDAGDGSLNVDGTATFSGGLFVPKDGAGLATVNVTGDLTVSGATFDQHASSTTSTSTVNVDGNFIMTSGTYDMSGVNGEVGTLNVQGNFEVTGGTFTETATGNGVVNFTGTGTSIFKSGGLSATAVINYIVNTGASLQFDLPATLVTGAGAFTVQNGAFLGIRHAQGISTTATTGQVQVTGTKTYNTGATYEYNGAVAQVTGNGLTGALDLNFDNNSGTAVSLTNNNIAVSGNLLIRAGSLSAGAQTLSVGGNWTNNGAAFNAGTGNVVLNGAGVQTLGGTTSTTFNNLNLNKTTGTVSLGQSQNVNGTLNIGVNLDLGSFNLTMGAAAGTIGTLGVGSFSATKMIVASGSGELRKVFGPATGTLYAFPIGDNITGADYSPALITFTVPSATNGYVALKVVDAKHPNNGHVNSFLTRYWTVTQSGLTTFTAQLGFTYVDADINGTEANIRLGKWDGQGPWTRYGAASMNNPINSMLSDAVGTFSDFSGLDFLEILPVNFGKFRGWAPNTNTNSIEWEVFGETGVDKYEIEKLSSGDVFRSIGVQSPSNNGLDITYTFNDNAPNGGDNFYRIKATELTGEITYSPVVRVRNGGVTATAMKVYPNPVTGNTVNLSLQGIKAGKYEMVVSNNAGQVIYRSTTEQRAGNVMVQIPVSSSLPKGIYRVKVSNGENVMLSSFIKE